MKTLTKITLLMLALATLFSFVSCASPEDWETDVYGSDTKLGRGEKTVIVKVITETNEITFTIRTNAKTLGEALLDHKLIAGEDGAYGMYIKRVNGVLADYEVDGHYWSFTKNGELMMVGVDAAEIADGEQYELTRTK